MQPRQLKKEKREAIRSQLIELQEFYCLSYGQLCRVALKSHGLDLSRPGMFHFINKYS